jgi:hypothetical protein
MAKEIFTSGDSWLEWGYAPESVEKHQQHDQQSHGNWAGENSPNDYGMSHRPAQGKDGGASLDDVTN